MTTDQVKAAAGAAIAGLDDVWAYEYSEVDFATLAKSGSGVRVEFAGPKVLGRCPARNPGRGAWLERRRELAPAAIARAKEALDAAGLRYRESREGPLVVALEILGPKAAKAKD